MGRWFETNVLTGVAIVSLNFQQVQVQVKQMGDVAEVREKHLQELRQRAQAALEEYASQTRKLREKVDRLATGYDPYIRCALPAREPINTRKPLPQLPKNATLIAADGSQVNPDRHAEVNFCLINVGAIQLRMNSPEPPDSFVQGELLYDEQLYTPHGTITDNTLALMRDLNERRILLELATNAGSAPIVTFTDGPLELWSSFDPESATEYQRSLKEYLRVLSKLQEQGVTTAGYVDKPAANLVVRLLEIAITPADEYPEIRRIHPYRMVTDLYLFTQLLRPGERSAVFALQSRSASSYKEELGIHFFYLNVGREERASIARVEIPGWVAKDSDRLDALQAILVHQCQILGNVAYPYLLHRAHEAAVVTRDEKEQLSQMIVLELRRRGLPVGGRSGKGSSKAISS